MDPDPKYSYPGPSGQPQRNPGKQLVCNSVETINVESEIDKDNDSDYVPPKEKKAKSSEKTKKTCPNTNNKRSMPTRSRKTTKKQATANSDLDEED